MRIFTLHIVFISFSIFGQKQIFDSYQQLMGVDFVISIVSSNQDSAKTEIDFAIKETQRIERIISSWNPNSETSKINNNAGVKPVNVDVELLELIERSKRVSTLTSGAFDISIGPLLHTWKMDSIHSKIPDSSSIASVKSLVDFNNIEVNKANQTVFLTQKKMKIGFGGIGKGFIAEYLKVKLLKRGVKAGMISAGGDIVVWGEHPSKENWSIGLANPNNKKELLGYLRLKNTAVVTSGNYEKFITIDNKKYTHIINPVSGYPVRGLKSVTIICPNAELADALATACFVMGKDKGLELINQLKGIEALFIDEENKIHTSNSFQYEEN